MPTPRAPRMLPLLDNRGQPTFAVIGLSGGFLNDVYHRILSARWRSFLGGAFLVFLSANSLFALLYMSLPGAVQGARPGSFVDAFAFSVQTIMTIGYGVMSPGSVVGHVLVALEAFGGLVGTAIFTGLTFAKFSTPKPNVLFSSVCCVSRMDGVPTLLFRLVNARGNRLFLASMMVVVAKDDVTPEGEPFRRVFDIPLVRSTNLLFSIGWTVMHKIDEKSPLFGETQESLSSKRAELVAVLSGVDENSSASVYARRAFTPDEILFGRRFVDIVSVSEVQEGVRVFDYRRLNDTQDAPLERDQDEDDEDEGEDDDDDDDDDDDEDEGEDEDEDEDEDEGHDRAAQGAVGRDGHHDRGGAGRYDAASMTHWLSPGSLRCLSLVVFLASLAGPGCGDDPPDEPGAGGGGSSGQGGQAGLAGKGGSGVAGSGVSGSSGQTGATGGSSGAGGAGPAGTGGAGPGGAGAGGVSAGGASAGGAGQAGSGPAGAGGAGPGGASGAAGAGAGGQGGGALGGPFRYGVNPGFYTAKVMDADSAALAAKAGANSMRVKLSEQHLTTWGDDIEVGDMKAYQQLGMSEMVAFLGGPIAEHSTAPAGKAPWELEFYSPKNLYEPIFLPDGEVNPQNYWASFVARVAKTYGPWLKTYEIWNEPDQVGGNWQATLDWENNPPKPSDLLWWNDSIFAYIRLLRVAHEVVHKYDPDGQVALGGIGYPSFLSALLRYTDEPSGGAVADGFPARGGAYFDVLCYHYYPVFSPGNSDVGAEGLLKSKGEMEAKLAAAGVSGKGWLVTESGAPRASFDGKPGGEAYARNYLLKLMTLGQSAGLIGIDWFALGDGKKQGASTDPFDFMGLYLNYSDVQGKDQAQISPTGVAYATLGKLLGGALADPEGTKALALPAGVGGAALRTKAGQRAFVLWARDGQSEDAKASHALAASKPVKLYAWDHSATGAVEDRSPQGGSVSLELTSSPLIVVEP